MYALFLILNELEKVDNILEIFYELKLGATTLDSLGMGKVLLEHNVDIKILSSLKMILNENKPYSKTIISVIREKETLDEAINRINEELDIHNNNGIGFLFVLPVLQCYGGEYKETN